MKGDFSRSSFDAAKHFSAVLMQQGRVTLDADHNEQAAILLHALRTLTRDLFGPHGGPAADSGFALTLGPEGASSNLTLSIGAGHYYVDGILCECEGVTYDAQPDHALPADDALLGWLKAPAAGKFFWLYLDVWERHVSWVEDDSIREVALGGPDTCTRSQVVWQVKALEMQSAPECEAPLAGLVGIGAASLAARLDPGAQLPDPCVLAPDAQYRGAENQLYRVEIHHAGSLATGEQPSFKWSRDNGSVAVPWLDSDGNDLIVTRSRGFDAGIWVELLDDDDELGGMPGLLVKVIKVQGDRLSIDPATVPAAGLPPRNDALHPRVRRWDQIDNDAIALLDGAVPVVESDGGTGADGDWSLVLEDGIEVMFASGGQYRSGDYWLIPARVATGAIEWPATVDAAGQPLPDLRAPFGIEHHYAPLGIAGFAAGANEGAQLSNCRACFGLLAGAPCQANTLSQQKVAAGSAKPAAHSGGAKAVAHKAASSKRTNRRVTAKTRH